MISSQGAVVQHDGIAGRIVYYLGRFSRAAADTAVCIVAAAGVGDGRVGGWPPSL